LIRIENTKSDEPRTLPYGKLPALRALIQKRAGLRDDLKETGVIVPHVFHRRGAPIRHFRRAWISACIAAGLGHEVRDPDTKTADGKVKRGKLRGKVAQRIPHDYRRSAARNLSRAGVPERVIMDLCGWKTRSVFDRYRIVAEQDLADGLAKLAADDQPQDAAPQTGKVATFNAKK
jgi:integrase